MTESPQSRQDLTILLDVVGTQYVDDLIEAPLQLVAVIRNVRKSIGRFAGTLDQDAILLESYRLASKPDCSVAPGDQISPVQIPDDGLDRAGRVQRVLVEIDVEDDAEAFLGRTDLREDRLLGRFAKGVSVVIDQPFALLGNQRSRDVADVVALVAVFRELGWMSDLLEISGPHGVSEHLHLTPGVVEVILPLHAVSRTREQSSHRVAQNRVAAVADRERAGGIGRDELHLDVSSLAVRPDPEALALHQGQELRSPEPGRQSEVDESRAGDLRRGDPAFRVIEVRDQCFGDRTRGLALPFGHGERQIGGEVTMRAVFWDLQTDARRRFGRQSALPARRLETALEHLLDTLLHCTNSATTCR